MASFLGSCKSSIKSLAEGWLPKSFYNRDTWSQCGEDRILSHILPSLVRDRPIQYVDIGANHPYHLNNTILFYVLGGHGLLVEPNPHLAKILSRKRPRDAVLQCGVSIGSVELADYYMFASHTLNTFSKREASRYVEMGQQQIATEKLQMKNVNEILGMVDHLDLLNLDVEGLDLEILQEIDWERFRPSTICVETISFEIEKEPKKSEEILEYLRQRGYRTYADTLINTIFLHQDLWNARFSRK